MEKILSCAEMIEYVNEIGLLPLLPMGIKGWSADEAVDPECRYVILDDGSWEWALWKWKGDIIKETGCAYGKFFRQKAAFVSREWWPDLCNWRRTAFPAPEENSIDDLILQTLRENGSMVTRQLRKECGFTGPKMRSRFDAHISKLQMACRIVTEDFVYPRDRNGHEYGWGFSLLTTPERLFGLDACHIERTPQESFDRLFAHLRSILPDTPDKRLRSLLD